MKKLIFAAFFGLVAGFVVGMVEHDQTVQATQLLKIYAANITAGAVTAPAIAAGAISATAIAAKGITLANIQGGALNTVPVSNADGGLAYGVCPTGATGATGASGAAGATGTIGTVAQNCPLCSKNGTTLGGCIYYDGGASCR